MYIGIIGRKDGKTMEKPQNALGKKKQLRLMTFLIAFFVATAFFIPFLITGHGYFIFFGDFNVQQIPFYRYCHDAVRNGQFGWSYVTDLGSNFIGSYAFYLLGSPFFWLTIPFPGSVVPYLMAPLLILKFCGSHGIPLHTPLYRTRRDCHDRRSALCVFRIFRIQYILQSFS